MTPADFDYLRRLLKERSGLDLSREKGYLLESRLLPIARRENLDGITDLVRLMRSGNAGLVASVVAAMTTNETFFFRDKTPFDHLNDMILPALLQARASRRSLRIWCAASSTGQEPYSIAICLKELGAQIAGWRVEILATDLSEAVLERSKAGIFSQFEVQRGLPIQFLLKYFKQTGETWQISPELRSMITHRSFNLLDDCASFGKFDIIFCRNVLIYFDQETKSAVFSRLANVLETDGYLALGGAETVLGLTDALKPCPDRRGIYLRDVPSPSLAPRMTPFKVVA